MANDTVEAPAETVEEVAPESSQETEVAEPQAAPEAPKAFDPNTIDAQTRQYFEAQTKEKYKDYDTLRQEAQWAGQVRNDPRFQEWSKSLNQPKTPEFQISEAEHAEALGNPAKFQELVMKAATHVASQQFAPKIGQLEAETQFAKASAELSQVVSRHPEFKELDQAGHILPVLQKYPGISFEDALAIAKQTSGWEAKKAAKAAAGEVQTQKKAITERPGNPGSTGRGKKHFKTSSEALEWIAEEAEAGRHVDPDDWESDD